MKIRPEEITSIIKSEIEGFEGSLEVEETGPVREVSSSKQRWRWLKPTSNWTNWTPGPARRSPKASGAKIPGVRSRP